jgi:Holliday junction resolvasome RuvABC endonuclease subunit
VKIVGLDLSLTSTGYARITDPDKAVPMWWSHTQGSKALAADDKVWVSVHNRIHSLCTELLLEVDRDAPDLVVMEGPSLGSKGAGTWDRAGLWWLVYDGLHRQGQTVAVAPPANVKIYATGKGGGADASKDAVLLAAARRYKDAPISNNNEADAIVLAAMGCRHLGHPVEKSLPTTHLRALTGCQWPTTLPVRVAPTHV